MLATIGYEKSSLAALIAELTAARIDTLVDVRERAQSRRPGFSKTALSQSLREAGITYLHLRALGDPKPGRDAARAGDMAAFQQIFRNSLATPAAQEAFATLVGLAASTRVCLLCYERDYNLCHRKIISDDVEQRLGQRAVHLGVGSHSRARSPAGRVRYSRESTATSV